MDTNPICLIAGTDSGVIAPAQAIVVSSLAKFRIPATDGRVTSCAADRVPDNTASVRAETPANVNEGIVHSGTSVSRSSMRRFGEPCAVWWKVV